MTDALRQADRFEQIARWWDDGLRAFRHAVDGSLASAWSGVGAVAAGSAVEGYVARAHDLTLALEELPGVVRAAAEAIVATRYAVGSPVVEDSDAAAWSVSSAVHATGSASAHGAASAAEEDARAAMRQRYVLPFAELVTRIPLLPMPLRSLDSDATTGDRQSLIDGVGQSRGDRRTPSPVEIATGGAENETAATGEDSALHDAIRDSETVGRDGLGTEVPNDGSEGFDSQSAESEDGAVDSGTATTVTSASTAATGMTQPGGTAALTVPGGSGLLTAPTGTSSAAIDPSVVSTGRDPSADPVPGRAWPNVSPSGARGLTPGGSAQYRPPGQRDVSRPGIGHSIPGSAGPVIGAAPPSGHTPTRSGDRYFHCGGALPTGPGVEATRGLPEYLITQANTAELLGEPRPAIAGGVIGGGDDLAPGEQRSSATRG
ncbi:hypothetical protein QX204_05650 [Nocardia sp. PE-7]|uniref:hypothetical protein n=1 Tax=Nocardia sp. PE-7 TaxID=3058426 RepID=UPI002658A0AE|nr:hypothetical protein [Nocardia sp. PE-7]WKG10969.1 hypothetical protein QX204_05650 [Nocardia sp. PE-7]